MARQPKIVKIAPHSLVSGSKVANVAVVEKTDKMAKKGIETQNTAIWVGYPQLKRICSCESAFGGPNNEPRQFDSNGAMIVGKPNPADWGACQINSTLWQKISMQLGYDIKTYAGNIGFAKWLYDKKGSNPWLWSSGCWSK